MADFIKVEMDASGVLAALEKFGTAAEKHIDEACRQTAEAVAAEARKRVRIATGETRDSIRVEKAYNGQGYVVLAGTQRRDAGQFARSPTGRGIIAPGHVRGHHVQIYLEYGTVNMDARPFFWQSARLEEGNHLRRLNRALKAAADEAGLGE